MLVLMTYELRKLMSWKMWSISLLCLLGIPLLFLFSSIPDPIDQAYYAKYQGEVNAKWFQAIEAKQMALQKEHDAFRMEQKNEIAMDPHNVYFLHSLVYSNANSIYHEAWRLDPMTASSTFVRETMEAHKPYIFGDPLGGEGIVWTLTYMGILTAAFLSVVMARSFTIDRQGSFYDLLTSTKEGKRRVGRAKLGIVILVPLILSSIICVLYVGLGTVLFHPDYRVSAMVGGNTSPYTYGELTMFACMLVMLGACASSLIAASFSVSCKSSMRSLVASLLVFLAPAFTQSITWEDLPIARILLPSNFMFFPHVLQDQPMIELSGNGMMITTLIPCIWIVVGGILTLWILLRFRCVAKS